MWTFSFPKSLLVDIFELFPCLKVYQSQARIAAHDTVDLHFRFRNVLVWGVKKQLTQGERDDLAKNVR